MVHTHMRHGHQLLRQFSMISLGLTVGAHMVDATTPRCPPSPSGAFRPQSRYRQALHRVSVDLEKEMATTEHWFVPVNVVLRGK